MDVDFMAGKMTSTEIVAMEIWKQLEPEINKNNCKLHCVKLCETDRNYVEYYG
jgi:6-pyruvoyltetrahydropterin/6-carboxytetrahydropterin synthase